MELDNGQTDPLAAAEVTVLVPAYNEEESIADTIQSLQSQTRPPDVILVIDDGSTDRTGEIASSLGATVLRPSSNTGSKAGAQNYALPHVKTPLVMAIDADTTLAPDAIELLGAAFGDERCAAACGFVVPRYVETLWERGRYIEYLLAFSWYKPIQDYYDRPLIASGCFSLYRTDLLRSQGGWSTRTMAEDMDLTWSYHEGGRGVRFIPEAVCYPIEPHDRRFMAKQLRRWSHGFVQNVRLHWRPLLDVPILRTFIAVALWDAVVASVAFLVLLPLLALLLREPLLLLGYVLDLPVVLIPVVVAAHRRGEVLRALASVPSFFVLRAVNAYFILEALMNELVLGRSLRTYEKGH
jgi:poly-beta-1,6-N-acetyl-D-glucosamine synthase